MDAASVSTGDALVVDEPYVAPRWVLVATELLALCGLGISIYLTIVHFESSALVCSIHGVFDCTKVTTSAQSKFLGVVPVVFLGLFQYTVMTGLCSPWAWRSTRREVHLARLVFASVGMAFVLWLIAAELLIINGVCEWCSGVHLVTFLIFIITVQTVPRMLGWTRR